MIFRKSGRMIFPDSHLMSPVGSEDREKPTRPFLTVGRAGYDPVKGVLKFLNPGFLGERRRGVFRLSF